MKKDKPSLKSRVKTDQPVTQAYPDKVSDMCDLLADHKDALKANTAREKRIKLVISDLEQHIIETLREQGNTIAQGVRMKVSVIEKTSYNVTDIDEFHAYIKEHDAFDLLTTRLGTTAIALRLADGVKLPVAAFTKEAIKATPIKAAAK